MPFRLNLRHAGHDRSFAGTRPFVISCAFPGQPGNAPYIARLPVALKGRDRPPLASVEPRGARQPLSLGPRNIIVAENPPVLVVAVAAICEPGPRKKLRGVKQLTLVRSPARHIEAHQKGIRAIEGIMFSKNLWDRSVPRVELDQRARDARLRLDLIERLALPPTGEMSGSFGPQSINPSTSSESKR